MSFLFDGQSNGHFCIDSKHILPHDHIFVNLGINIIMQLQLLNNYENIKCNGIDNNLKIVPNKATR